MAEMELSLSSSQLTLPLHHEVFLSSFFGFISFGLLNNEKYVKHQHFCIPTTRFEDFFLHCVDIIKFFCDLQNQLKLLDKHFISDIENQFFFIKYDSEKKLTSFLRYDTIEKDRLLYSLTFNINSFCTFLKAFKASILPSLNLCFEQNLFFHFLLKKNVNFVQIKESPLTILSLMTNFLETYNLKSKNNLYLIEMFEFYYDNLLFVQKLEQLLTQLSLQKQASSTNPSSFI